MLWKDSVLGAFSLEASGNQDEDKVVLRLEKRRTKSLDVTVKKIIYVASFAVLFMSNDTLEVIVAPEWFGQLHFNSFAFFTPIKVSLSEKPEMSEGMFVN